MKYFLLVIATGAIFLTLTVWLELIRSKPMRNAPPLTAKEWAIAVAMLFVPPMIATVCLVIIFH